MYNSTKYSVFYYDSWVLLLFDFIYFTIEFPNLVNSIVLVKHVVSYKSMTTSNVRQQYIHDSQIGSNSSIMYKQYIFLFNLNVKCL